MVSHWYTDRLRTVNQEGFHTAYTEALMPNSGNSHRTQDLLETTQSTKPCLVQMATGGDWPHTLAIYEQPSRKDWANLCLNSKNLIKPLCHKGDSRMLPWLNLHTLMTCSQKSGIQTHLLNVCVLILWVSAHTNSNRFYEKPATLSSKEGQHTSGCMFQFQQRWLEMGTSLMQTSLKGESFWLTFIWSDFSEIRTLNLF